MSREGQERESVGTEFRDEKEDLGKTRSRDEPFHQDTLVTTTIGSMKTDSPFFIRDLTYSHEEEKKIIRIIDTRLFRKLRFH